MTDLDEGDTLMLENKLLSIYNRKFNKHFIYLLVKKDVCMFEQINLTLLINHWMKFRLEIYNKEKLQLGIQKKVLIKEINSCIFAWGRRCVWPISYYD